jgi:excisionase family DNA binding protein
MEKLLTTNEIAEYLSVTPRTVRGYVAVDFIPYIKIGGNIRFKPSKIEKWVERKERKGRSTYKLSVESFPMG